jgi:hypothetical protein
VIIRLQYIQSSLIEAMAVSVLVSAFEMARDVASGSNAVLIRSAQKSPVEYRLVKLKVEKKKTKESPYPQNACCSTKSSLN